MHHERIALSRCLLYVFAYIQAHLSYLYNLFEIGVEILGSVPLDPRIGKSADYGVSFLDEYPNKPGFSRISEHYQT
jgi:hypothetical protein